MPSILAYALLFTAIGAFFVFIHLVIGKLVRPNKPDAEKKTVYECGEPTIGSAWVQFDLRFYVVALLFVIFDVEMAFFFPWAVVFGKANQLASELPTDTKAREERIALNHELSPGQKEDDRKRAALELGDPQTKFGADVERLKAVIASTTNANERATLSERLDLLNRRGPDTDAHANVVKNNRESASSLGWVAFGDILVFFGVLLVGFAYLWRRGDLDWVRSVAAQRLAAEELEPSSLIRNQKSEVSEAVV